MRLSCRTAARTVEARRHSCRTKTRTSLSVSSSTSSSFSCAKSVTCRWKGLWNAATLHYCKVFTLSAHFKRKACSRRPNLSPCCTTHQAAAYTIPLAEAAWHRQKWLSMSLHRTGIREPAVHHPSCRLPSSYYSYYPIEQRQGCPFRLSAFFEVVQPLLTTPIRYLVSFCCLVSCCFCKWLRGFIIVVIFHIGILDHLAHTAMRNGGGGGGKPHTRNLM